MRGWHNGFLFHGRRGVANSNRAIPFKVVRHVAGRGICVVAFCLDGKQIKNVVRRRGRVIDIYRISILNCHIAFPNRDMSLPNKVMIYIYIYMFIYIYFDVHLYICVCI